MDQFTLIFVAILLLIVINVLLAKKIHTEVTVRKSVCVIVLGDLGHSPRMNYHTLSLAKAGFQVNFIGYSESSLFPSITSNPNITVIPLQKLPEWVYRLPRIITYILKALFQCFSLWFSLPFFSSPSHLLLQNPPGIPALPSAWLYCLVHRSKLVVDFHNYTYSILALALSNNHPLVKFTKFAEKVFGSRCDSGLCVTRAMQEDLAENWSTKATVLYDRPPSRFHPIDNQTRHKLFCKLAKTYPVFSASEPNSSVFTEKSGEEFSLREDRPALLVSSTSWTEDEDFSVLLEALTKYETSESSVPKLICVITGKGPMKEMYCEKIEKAGFKRVSVVTPWLEVEDYPSMLAAADLGVCLHTSSSGMDLPMKVVDMFGCGLPVAAIQYNCLDELVKDGVNGVVFKDGEELADVLVGLFKGFPGKVDSRLGKFRDNLEEFRELGWEENWTSNALPLFS